MYFEKREVKRIFVSCRFKSCCLWWDSLQRRFNNLTITFLRKFWPGTTLQHHWSMQFQKNTNLIDQQTTILVASLLSPSVTQVIGHRTIASSPLDILLTDKIISWVGRCILFRVDISCKTPDCTSFNIFKDQRRKESWTRKWPSLASSPPLF